MSDGTHDTPNYVGKNEKSYPLVTSKCITNGTIDVSLANHISTEDYEVIDKRSHVDLKLFLLLVGFP